MCLSLGMCGMLLHGPINIRTPPRAWGRQVSMQCLQVDLREAVRRVCTTVLPCGCEQAI